MPRPILDSVAALARRTHRSRASGAVERTRVRAIGPIARIAAIAAAVCSIAACAADQPRRITIERTDSAGIAIIDNRGPDLPLPWAFTPTLTLGGEDEGPESFFQLGQTSVAADMDGNLYIMDAGNHRIVVFDEAGNLLRTLGRKGGGPGEFQMWPRGITIANDGSINVFDAGKRGLVRFAADGAPLQTRRIERGRISAYASWMMVSSSM